MNIRFLTEKIAYSQICGTNVGTSYKNGVYDNSKETNESSHKLFRGTFPSGFVWEVLDVFSGPPTVGFSWRHWGRFHGNYKENEGGGETVTIFGFAVGTVDEALKLTNVQVYFKQDEFLRALGTPAQDIAGLTEALENKTID